MIDAGLALSFAQSLTEQENSALYAVSSCLTYVVAVTFWSLEVKPRRLAVTVMKVSLTDASLLRMKIRVFFVNVMHF